MTVRRWVAVSFLFVLIVSAAGYARLTGDRRAGAFDFDPPTPYFRYTPTGTSRGRVLAIHGLSSNKSVMSILCHALADAGFEVFSIDLPGHGDSGAVFGAFKARDVVEKALDRLGPDTAVLGHSLGGALLLDVANDRPVGSMVLFSPAPTPIARIQARRLLVVEGQFDPERIRAFVPEMEDAAEGSVEFRDLAWTGHSGALFRPPALESVASWLGGDAGGVRTGQRLGLLALMALSSLGLGVVFLGSLSNVKVPGPGESGHTVALSYVLAAGGAAIVLSSIPAGAWVRLFPVDYLIGMVLLVGLVLVWPARKATLSWRRFVIGAAAAAYLIAVPGWFAADNVLHLALSDGRWWRFPAIALASLPLFLADESLLRPIRPWWKAAVWAALCRLVLGAVAVSGVLILNRESAFLLLLTHLIVLFWIGLWLAGELVWRKSGVFGAAVFAALVQGWVFAAVFVIV